MTSKPITCWICGKTVDLNTCKTDERGLAVHEPCYASRTIVNSNRPEPSSSANERSE